MGYTLEEAKQLLEDNDTVMKDAQAKVMECIEARQKIEQLVAMLSVTPEEVEKVQTDVSEKVSAISVKPNPAEQAKP